MQPERTRPKEGWVRGWGWGWEPYPQAKKIPGREDSSHRQPWSSEACEPALLGSGRDLGPPTPEPLVVGSSQVPWLSPGPCPLHPLQWLPPARPDPFLAARAALGLTFPIPALPTLDSPFPPTPGVCRTAPSTHLSPGPEPNSPAVLVASSKPAGSRAKLSRR